MKAIIPRQIKEYTLGIYDGPHATPKEASDGAIFLGIKNITNDGHLDLSEIRYVSEEDFPRWTKRVVPQPGDVVFTYEATLHRYSIIPDGFRGCLGRRVALVRPDPKLADSRFLLYYFLSPQWRRLVESFIVTGATVDRIPLEKFPEFLVALPDLPLQREIASILTAYDDLIENNRRRMSLLEESARLLHREWFINFRFPGHEHAKITKGVPEGWQHKILGELCTEIREPVNPDSLEPETPYIGLEHMPRRSLSLCKWGKAEEVTSTKHRFKEGEILFGKIRPYFHKVGIAFTDGIASSDAIVIRPIEEKVSEYVLMIVSSDAFVAATAQTMKEGSKMPRADWKQMQQHVTPLPPDGLLNSFRGVIAPILKQLRTLAFTNNQLLHARDLLLPKTMNGEIAV